MNLIRYHTLQSYVQSKVGVRREAKKESLEEL